MKTIKQYFSKPLAVMLLAGALIAPTILGTASAQVAYDPNGTPTSKTPVFSNFYNVPNGVGNEADFVRLKPQAGGNDAYVDGLKAACNNGDAYTVRTYVHNGADPNFNNNGTGSAVAHNVVVAMQAPTNTTNSTFTFASTVVLSNASTIKDFGQLNCNGKNVKLTLVTGSVKTYAKFLGTQGASDSAVNGSLKIGSRAQGSGDVWGCWDDRVTVTYEVKVEEITTPPPVVSTGVCKALSVVTAKDRKVSVAVSDEVKNAQIVGYKIDFGDGTTSNKQKDTHQYAKDGTYKIVASVQVKFADGHTEWKTAQSCMKQVTFKDKEPPVVVPPTTTPPTTTTPTPSSLPDTGPGSVAAIFVAVSTASGIGYYVFSRKFYA